MRLITRGMQIFQRQTEYLETAGTITRQVTAPFWLMPDNCKRIIEIRDSNNRKILQQEFTQYNRNVEMQSNGVFETPRDYDYRSLNAPTRMIQNLGRELGLQPDTNPLIPTDTTLTVYYVPDIPAFTQPSAVPTIFDIWAAWYPLNTNFNTMFTTARIALSLSLFEQAFVDYACAQYLKSSGIANYKVFEDNFMMEVKNAIDIKPFYAKESTLLYNFAPWS
jgi:hypothetical protein